MRARGWVVCGAGLVACAGVAAGVLSRQTWVMPALPGLKQGWNALKPGAGTGCATGAAYRFFVRPGAGDRLLVLLDGGGACWTGSSCDPRGRPTYASEPASVPPNGGVFDVRDPQNPFAHYSMVTVG